MECVSRISQARSRVPSLHRHLDLCRILPLRISCGIIILRYEMALYSENRLYTYAVYDPHINRERRKWCFRNRLPLIRSRCGFRVNSRPVQHAHPNMYNIAGYSMPAFSIALSPILWEPE